MPRHPARERRSPDMAAAAGAARWQQPNRFAWLTDNNVSTWRQDRPRP